MAHIRTTSPWFPQIAKSRASAPGRSPVVTVRATSITSGRADWSVTTASAIRLMSSRGHIGSGRHRPRPGRHAGGPETGRSFRSDHLPTVCAWLFGHFSAGLARLPKLRVVQYLECGLRIIDNWSSSRVIKHSAMPVMARSMNFWSLVSLHWGAFSGTESSTVSHHGS